MWTDKAEESGGSENRHNGGGLNQHIITVQRAKRDLQGCTKQACINMCNVNMVNEAVLFPFTFRFTFTF